MNDPNIPPINAPATNPAAAYPGKTKAISAGFGLYITAANIP